MNGKLFEDAIIIGVDVYKLVNYKGEDQCSHCDLRVACDNGCHGFCVSAHSAYESIYEYQGTVDEVIAKNEKRKLARHYIAVLIQQKRYYDAALYKDLQIYKLPKASEMVKAVEFLIKELKEVFK